MEAQLQKLRERLINIAGTSSILFVTIYFLFTFGKVTRGNWTFFEDGVGDVLVLGLLTAAYVFLLSLYYVTHRHGFRRINFVIIGVSIVYISLTTLRLREMQGEDHRWQDFLVRAKSNAIPQGQ